MASSSFTETLLDQVKTIPPALPPGRSELPTYSKRFVSSLTTSSSTSDGSSKNVSVDTPSPEGWHGVRLDTASTSTLTVGHGNAENNRKRPITYWRVINRRRAVVALLTSLVILLITAGIITAIYFQMRNKRSAVNTSSSTQQRQLESTDQNVSDKVIQSEMFGGTGGGHFSGETAYKTGGPLTGLTMWLGDNTFGMSMQAT